MKYIEPNFHIVGGIGHTFANWISGRALSLLTENTEFVHVPINAPKSGGEWDDFLNFGEDLNRKNEVDFETEVKIDEFDHYNKSEIERVINFIDSCEDNVLFKLSYDQYPGILFRQVRKIKGKLKEKYRNENKKKESDKKIASVHVRRGDITPEKNGGKWLDDSYYIECIEYIKKNFSTDLKFNLISQGEREDFLEFEKLGVDFRLNENPKKSFKRMTDSNILVTSNSGYSVLASILSDGYVLYHPFPGYSADYTGWINTQDETMINMKNELKQE